MVEGLTCRWNRQGDERNRNGAAVGAYQMEVETSALVCMDGGVGDFFFTMCLRFAWGMGGMLWAFVGFYTRGYGVWVWFLMGRGEVC